MLHVISVCKVTTVAHINVSFFQFIGGERLTNKCCGNESPSTVVVHYKNQLPTYGNLFTKSYRAQSTD